MHKKAKVAIFLLGAYFVIFWIGFKCGSAYLRMHNKIQAERIELPAVNPSVEVFYLIEKINYGSYVGINMSTINSDNVIMQMFMNEKLRPLLKLRDIEIYKQNGDRLY